MVSLSGIGSTFLFTFINTRKILHIYIISSECWI